MEVHVERTLSRLGSHKAIPYRGKIRRGNFRHLPKISSLFPRRKLYMKFFRRFSAVKKVEKTILTLTINN